MILNPELQFSGNNEVATVKLDIFGEVVVTLGTVPQGQGHETTSAQVVADILGVHARRRARPRRATTRTGTRHAGFSGTYASQFAVTGLGAVKGAADKLARRDEAARGGRLRLRRRTTSSSPRARRGSRATPRRRCRSWRSARSSTRTTPAFRRTLDVTLNVPLRLRPQFEKPDLERKFGNLTLTYATADPRLRGRDRPGDGRLRDRRLRGGGRLRQPHPSRRSSRDRCTARLRRRSAPRRTRSSPTTRRATSSRRTSTTTTCRTRSTCRR